MKFINSALSPSSKVEGETAGQAPGNFIKKRGRILIEEVDTLQVSRLPKHIVWRW